MDIHNRCLSKYIDNTHFPTLNFRVKKLDEIVLISEVAAVERTREKKNENGRKRAPEQEW